MRHYIIIALLLLAGTISAAKSKQVSDPLQDQQFTYYLYAAHSALDAGRYDDALALSEFARTIRPNDPTINFFLAILYEGTHRPKDALRAFQIAYAGSPDDYWQRYYAFLSRLNTPESRKTADKLIRTQYKRQPDNAEVLDAYQDYLVQNAKYSQALRVQDQIDRQEGRTPYNVLRRYRLLVMQGKTKEAMGVIEDYCKEDPDDLYFQALRGDLYLAQGQETKALEIYQSAGDNPYALQSLANYHKQHGQLAEARTTLNRLITVAPSEEVLTDYFDLISRDSTVSEDERVAFVQRAYLLEPNSAKWHYYWALALAAKDSIRDALSVCQEGLALADAANTEAVTRFSLNVIAGDLYMRLDSLQPAFAAYEAALMLDPENAYVLNNYAYTLAVNGGDLKKAEKMSQKTIEKEPGNPTYLDTYAWILHLQGQDTLAAFYIKRAMEKAGDMTGDEELRQHYQIILYGEPNPKNNE